MHTSIYFRIVKQTTRLMEKILEVGDKIKITPRFGKIWIVKIVRVTKTKAISEPINEGSATFDFKREYNDPKWIRPFSPIKWDTCYYELIK